MSARGVEVDAYESPLVVIERAVQERAKDISLEMSDPGGEAKLRALIEAEVDRWDDDFRHGRRGHDLADPELVVERAFRNMARYGPLTALLADDDVWEILVNSPGQHFVRRHQGPSGYHDEVFHDDEHVLRTLTKLLDDASRRTASSTRPRACRTPSSTTAPGSTSSTATSRRGGHVLVNIRQVHRHRLQGHRRAGRARTCSPPRSPRSCGPACAPGCRSCSRAARLGQDDVAVVHGGRARPVAAGGGGGGGVRDRRPRAQCGPDADPPGAATARPSTCAAWSRASSAWRPTWPSSARCATEKHSPNFALTSATARSPRFGASAHAAAQS